MAVITILVSVGIGLLSAGINYYIAHRRQQTAISEIKPEGFEADGFPRVTESQAIPVVFGTRRVSVSNCVWFGETDSFQWPNRAWDINAANSQDDAKVGRFRYSANMILVVCLGPVNTINRLWVGEAIADDTPRTITSGVSRIKINRPNLFGGSEGEGGVVGMVSYQGGYQDLPTHPYILERLPDISGAYRGLVTCLVGGDVIADSPWSVGAERINPRYFYHGTRPVVRPFSFDVHRTTVRGFGDAQWYSAKADIDGDMNPAHIIHEALTDRAWGLGLPDSRLDLDSFEAAADIFHEEGLGLSAIWTQQTSVGQLISEVLRHADCIRYIDQPTGKWIIKPIRDEGEEGLAELGQDEVQEVTTFSRPSSSERITTMSLIYRDRATDKDRTVTLHDQAAISVRGEIADTVQYPFISSAELANQIAIRDLRQLSLPRASVELMANPGAASTLKPGDTFILKWPEYLIEKIILRVVSVDVGDAIDSSVRIEAVEDVFRSESTIYGNPEDGEATDPTPTPADATDFTIFEMPLLLRAIEEGVNPEGPLTPWQTLYNSENGRACLGVSQPSAGHSSFEMWVNTAGQDPAPVERVTQWADKIEAAFTYGPEDIYIDIAGRVSVNDLVLHAVTGEIMRVTHFAAGSSTMTVERGLFDTVPALTITLGQKFYIIGSYIEQAGGAMPLFNRRFGIDAARTTDPDAPRQVELRALTATGRGQLDYDDATGRTIFLAQRPFRPYPPGAFSATQGGSSVVVAWEHRDRTVDPSPQQDDSGLSAPETGVKYELKIWQDQPVAGTLLRTVDLTDSEVKTYEYLDDTEIGDSPGAELSEIIRFEMRSYRGTKGSGEVFSTYAQVRRISRT